MSDNPKLNPGTTGDLSSTARALVSAVDRQYEEYIERERTETDEIERNSQTYHRDSARILKNILVYCVLISSLAVLIYAICCCISAFIYTDHTRLCSLYLLQGMACANILMLIISSAWPYWNYQKRKKYFLFVIASLWGIFFLEAIYMLISAFIVPLLLLPEPNQWVTESKWMFLIRVVTIVPSVVATVFFVQWEFLFIFDKFTLETIYNFRILDHIDLRKDKKYLYDAVVVRKLSNGKKWVVRYVDRFMHWLINGSTGTAKTSSIIIPMINGDLKKRCLNEDMQKKLMWDGLQKGHFRLASPVTDRYFSTVAFIPTDDVGAEIKKVVEKKYKKIGITVIGPDDSLSDVTYQLCESKNIPCNRIDPITDKGTNGKDKKGFIGFNPLYISPRIPEWARSREIVKRATLFADVMQAINEMKGKGDPYFTSINRSVTVAFSICLCVTFPKLRGRQPNPADVQEMVNDFQRIKPYYEELVKIDEKMAEEQGNKIYGFVEDFIAWDVLGKGQEKMMEQARGLRMMMNEFLTNPLIRRTLCPPEDQTVDLDKMLEEGQITAVNYALELGETDSKGFGLFFLLSFIDAVFRRSGAEGSEDIPHVLIIDELPVIIHPQFERAISLFRKYKVSIVGCLQSLDQMEKNDATKYLRDVLMGGCATHTLFGRCGVNEMRRYSELAGKEWRVVETESQSETSITDEAPSLSYSTRESLQQQEVLDGSSIRNRHFQEITMFTVVDGNLVPPFYGKVDFLDPTEKNWMKRETYKWEEYYNSITPTAKDIEQEDIQIAEEMIDESDDEDDVNLFVGGGKITLFDETDQQNKVTKNNQSGFDGAIREERNIAKKTVQKRESIDNQVKETNEEGNNVVEM